MFLTEENWLRVLPKFEKIYKDYDKKFSKFDGELTELFAMPRDKNKLEFVIPRVKFHPFGERASVSTIDNKDDGDEIVYNIRLPNNIYSDEDFDDVVNGLEKITSCKLFYENFIDEIKELF